MIRDSYYAVLFDSRTNTLMALADLNDDERAHFCTNIKIMLTEYELAHFSKEN